jgi:drug/metabolite transporter (DMT)-like permease
VNPVVAVFLGWLLAGEAVGARTLVATAIILSGVALVNRAGREPGHAPLEDRDRRMVRIGGQQCSSAD